MIYIYIYTILPIMISGDIRFFLKHNFVCRFKEIHGYPCRWSVPVLNFFLTTLTFGALRRNHSVSTTFKKKKQKKDARCPRAISNVS